MGVSIKKRIYWSFLLLVSLFVINGVITISTLNSINKLSALLSNVIEPSIQSINDFNRMMVESKMYTTNWVFLRSNQEDKDLLIKLHDVDYSAIKTRVSLHFSKWGNQKDIESLNKIFTGFEELMIVEKSIMGSLKKFEDYDNPMIKFEAERKVEEEILPRTAHLISDLNTINEKARKFRKKENTRLETASLKLSAFIIVLAVTIICLGIFLSIYMASVIISPISKIRHIVNDLGKGIIRKVDYETGKNEIGEMVRSVNNLSEKLQATATFAAAVGNRNFDAHFDPLGDEDTLGKALITMRNNLKSVDERLNEAQHVAHLGSWDVDFVNGNVFWSDELYRILDQEPQAFAPSVESFMTFVHPDDKEKVNNCLTKCLADHLPFTYECRIISKTGIIKDIFSYVKTSVDDNDQITKMFGISQDITERKLGELKLAAERELLLIMIENIPDQIYLKDTESRFMLCNTPVATNAGCKSQADMIGKTDYDFFPENADELFAIEQELIKSGIPIINQEECVYNKLSGQLRWRLSTKVPLKDHTGKKIGLICINRDITQRKISEKKIEDANRELSILFNSIDEVFFSVDMVNLKVIQISATCEKLYGYSTDEFMANSSLWLQRIYAEDMHLVESGNEPMLRGEQINNQYRIVRKDNTTRWVETKITPTLDSNGKLVRIDGVTSDITERKQAEDKLQSSEERYRQIVETAQEGIWMIDENTNTTFVNKKMSDMLGYTIEEMMGKKIEYFMDEEGIKEAATNVENGKSGEGQIIDSKFFTKSGKVVWTRMSTNPVFDDAGNYQGALAMVIDITKRKYDEELLRKSEAFLELKNKELEVKNRELEQFAYVASHDLQEPLRTTSSFAELLQKQYSEKLDEKANKYLTFITQSSDRMKVLIKDLLDYSRIGRKKEVDQVDCNIMLSQVLEDLNKSITDEKAIVQAGHLPVVSGYVTEIQQLFQNLVMNAIKFRRKGTRPEISITANQVKDYWEFSVKDNGIGIEEKHNERIFIIFQRLHNRGEYKGSGIGLSHCKKIVELHGGKIWVNSALGEGCTFKFTLPCKQAAQPAGNGGPNEEYKSKAQPALDKVY